MENINELREYQFSNLESLKNIAVRAFSWTSHDPEGRGLRTLIDFDKELTQDLKNMPENEQEYFKIKYIDKLKSWFGACSNCASSFITGGSNFNVRKAEAANNTERNRYNEFREWREWQFKQIAKRQEAAKSPEERESELIEKTLEDIIFTFKNDRFINLLYNRVEKYAYKGMVRLIKLAVEEVSKQNAIYGRITPRHKFFRLVELAEKHATNIEEKKVADNKEELVKGIKCVHNTDIDRLQLFFEGKPAQETINLLKKNAFRWSPSQGAWQRQLTSNAIWGAKRVLESL